MAMEFTKADAEALATFDRNYVVRVIRKRHPSQMDRYGVWDSKSDHWVEFDLAQQSRALTGMGLRRFRQ